MTVINDIKCPFCSKPFTNQKFHHINYTYNVDIYYNWCECKSHWDFQLWTVDNQVVGIVIDLCINGEWFSLENDSYYNCILYKHAFFGKDIIVDYIPFDYSGDLIKQATNCINKIMKLQVFI